MSRINEMIARLAPTGVRFVALEDVAAIVSGLTGKTKSDFLDGDSRYVSYKNVFSNLAVDQLAPDFVKVGDGEKQNTLREGDVVITGSSESLEEVGMSSVVMTEPLQRLYLNSFCFALRLTDRSLLLPGFSKYLFRSDLVRAQIRRSASGVTRINISKARFMKIRVPVPPLEVQREIVRVLDQFTQLEARKQQYDHYRAEILASVQSAEWSTLGAISSKVSSGGTPSSGNTSYYGGAIPWLRTQEVDFDVIRATRIHITEAGLRNSAANWVPVNCVIVAMYGATAAKVAINAIPLTTNQACCNLQINEEIAEFRYVFHWIYSQYEKLKALGEGSQSNLNAKKVKEFPIPVPSLEEQRRIVEVLDKFDGLVNDLSVGLPAELNARRKQYEYYRDKLLTFEEAAA